MSDADTRRLTAEALAAGEPTAWFERLCAEAALRRRGICTQ